MSGASIDDVVLYAYRDALRQRAHLTTWAFGQQGEEGVGKRGGSSVVVEEVQPWVEEGGAKSPGGGSRSSSGGGGGGRESQSQRGPQAAVHIAQPTQSASVCGRVVLSVTAAAAAAIIKIV